MSEYMAGHLGIGDEPLPSMNELLKRAEEKGRADVMEKINELKEHYADACCICTKMDCDVCDIKTFIKELEQIGAEE